MYDHYYAVIMAGGGGTRLWPLSRQSKPKQMLRLGSQRTLFQKAVDRLDGLFPPERIFVVTVANQAGELQKEIPEIPTQNFLIEPMARGTASVVGLAAAALHSLDSQATMAVLTADHFIENVVSFQNILRSAYAVAQTGWLVTLGIRPTFAATGYGYIEIGEELGKFEEQSAYRVARFKEKPDEATAQAMLAGGRHVWNSGMFIWRAVDILVEFQRLMPELKSALDRISSDWGTPQQMDTVQSIWPSLKPETIDYGIMEHARQAAVLPAESLGWNDVGSWDSLFDVLKPDGDGNILIDANHLGLDSSGLLVCTEKSEGLGEDAQRLIVTIGLRDMIIVDTRDAVLICPRLEAQKVRTLVNLLKEKGYQPFL